MEQIRRLVVLAIFVMSMLSIAQQALAADPTPTPPADVAMVDASVQAVMPSLEPNRTAVSDGHALTAEEQAHDAELWQAVYSAQLKLDEDVADELCEPGMFQQVVHDSIDQGWTVAEAFEYMEDDANYWLNGDWAGGIAVLEPALLKAQTESIGPAPEWASFELPTPYEVAVRLDPQYPGCSQGIRV